MRYRILVVDDEPWSWFATKELLEKHGYTVDTANNGGEALEKIKSSPSEYAVVILDYRMEGKDGATTAKELLSINRDLHIIIYSADRSQNAVSSPWRAGAVMFVRKGDREHFLQAVKKWYEKYLELHDAAERGVSHSENEKLISSIGLIGQSKALADIVREIKTFGERQLDANVIIQGESGVGKERIARAIHDCSARKQNRFVAVNCGAIPENLVESVLFGHEKGAFTGAHQRQAGKFKVAHKGSILLDEIGETTTTFQVKLLRAIQTKKITPVGYPDEIPVDVRVIAATNQDLELAIKESRFRQDLFYRLNVLSIRIPPLRERPEDVELLVLELTRQFNEAHGTKKSFLRRTIEAMQQYSWPGNVRELENVVEKLLNCTSQDKITLDDLDDSIRQPAASESLPKFSHHLDTLKKQKMVSALAATKSLRRAAAKLGMPYSTFRDTAMRYGISVRRSGEGSK